MYIANKTEHPTNHSQPPNLESHTSIERFSLGGDRSVPTTLVLAVSDHVGNGLLQQVRFVGTRHAHVANVINVHVTVG